MRSIVQAVKVLVVMAHGVLLGLGMTQLVNRLHLAGNPCTGTTELATNLGVTLEGSVLKRRYTTEEQLQGVHVTGIGNVLVAVVLGKGVEDGVQLLLFLGLVLPVGVHGQTERIFPLGPVYNLDTFKPLIRIDRSEERRVGKECRYRWTPKNET